MLTAMSNNERVVKVVIGDISETVRTLLVNRLSAESRIKVVCATANGNELLRSIEEYRPEAAIIDAVLDGVSGIQVLQRLSEMENSPDVLMTSAFFSEKNIEDAKRLGVSYFACKPYNLNDIVNYLKYSDLISIYERKSDFNRNCKRILEENITDILHNLGVPAHIRGYTYLRKAVMLSISNDEMIKAVTKQLYPSVAKAFDTTASRVERSIRHAIEIAWDRGDIEVLQKFFGYTISNVKGKPTNSEFIALIADQMRLKYPEACLLDA